MADLGVASRTDMKEHADMIANLDPSKMLVADMDTGYGGRFPLSLHPGVPPSDQSIQAQSPSQRPSTSISGQMSQASILKTSSLRSVAAI